MGSYRMSGPARSGPARQRTPGWKLGTVQFVEIQVESFKGSCRWSGPLPSCRVIHPMIDVLHQAFLCGNPK